MLVCLQQSCGVEFIHENKVAFHTIEILDAAEILNTAIILDASEILDTAQIIHTAIILHTAQILDAAETLDTAQTQRKQLIQDCFYLCSAPQCRM